MDQEIVHHHLIQPGYSDQPLKYALPGIRIQFSQSPPLRSSGNPDRRDNKLKGFAGNRHLLDRIPFPA